MTGLAASGNLTSVQGVEAGIKLAQKDGYNVKYVLVDTASTPSGALSGAQKLVDEDHVFAVIAASSLFFAAAPFLASHGIPVIGSAQDGPEWLTDKNMFSPYGAGIGAGRSPVETTTGEAMKLEGVTNVGVLGYAYATSALAANADELSARDAGVKVGYYNASFPLGSTNVGPVTIAMKNAGVDGFAAPLSPNTALAAIAALRQLGVTLKGAFLYNGYGGDLNAAGPGAIHDAQGVFFGVEYEPFEMHTAATEKFQGFLQSAGVKGDPTFAEYNGYLSIAMLADGLKAAGSNPTQAGLINALNGINWNAEGLLGDHYLKLSDHSAQPAGIDGCTWLTKLVGSSFELVAGADPLCGARVPGQSASASG
jgi:ABC-type branched-subunit amino acid transport system substrate-binding protein